MILLLLACGGGAPCVPAPRASAPTFAITTADPRFTAGSFRVGDHDGLDPARFGTSADAIVRVLDGVVYVVERGGPDAITAFDSLDAKCSLWQTDLGAGANAHDVVLWDDRLVLPLYDAGELLVLATDGTEVERIQVPGARPALDRAVVVDGTLWVADQRFQRDTWSVSEGVLLAVTDDGIVEHGPIVNPRISPGRTADELLVLDGLLSLNDDPERRHDGMLRTFDTRSATFSEPLLTELELDADLENAVAVDGNVVLTATDAEARTRLHCLDAGDGPTHEGWISTLVPWQDQVLVAARSGPAGTGERGVWVVDPNTCDRTDRIVIDDSEAYDIASF